MVDDSELLDRLDRLRQSCRKRRSVFVTRSFRKAFKYFQLQSQVEELMLEMDRLCFLREELSQYQDAYDRTVQTMPSYSMCNNNVCQVRTRVCRWNLEKATIMFEEYKSGRKAVTTRSVLLKGSLLLPV